MKNLSIIHKVLVGLIVVAILVLLFALGSKPSPNGAAETAAEGEVATTAQSESSAPKSPSKATASPSKAVTIKAPKAVLLDLSTDMALTYRGILEEALEKEANFNKHYVVASWSCGNKCVSHAIVDKLTGKSYPAPTDTITGSIPAPTFVPYTLSSNVYKSIEGDFIKTYEFKNGQFVLVGSEQI